MSWIKRNLYFFIGSVVAVLLLGMGGFYLFSKIKQDNEVTEQLKAEYATLDRLTNTKPHPGNDKVDNIKLAKEHEQKLRTFVGNSKKRFEPIPAIPASTTVSSEEFTAQLRNVIAQLQRAAANSSVNLPPRYYFTFDAQKTLMKFAPGSLEPLAVQLGEIKAISEIFFQARVNSIDYIRRERVSHDDMTAGAADYLDKKSVTNDLAVISPYEVSFRCFSTELAAVLSGLAASPHCLIVKSINVESTASNVAAENTGAGVQPNYPVAVPQPSYPAPSAAAESDPFGRRAGPGGKGAPGPQYSIPAPAPAPTYATPAPARPQNFINEKPLKVTVMIDVVKLLPPPAK